MATASPRAAKLRTISAPSRRAPPVTVGTALISFGDGWKYMDDGSNQGTLWTGRFFNDSQWTAGPARLGYGGDGEITTVSYGTNINAKFTTTYFRKAFTVAAPAAFSGLLLRLIRDDGAVVYLNGVEVYRNNLQAGPVSWNSLATVSVDGGAETTPLDVPLSTAALVSGANVLAVEIHQFSPANTDLGFDVALTGLNATNLAAGLYLISPAQGAHFNAPAGIPLSAFAAAPEPVTLVEYFEGDTKVGRHFGDNGECIICHYILYRTY